MEKEDIKIPEVTPNEDELLDKEDSESSELRMFITEDESGLTKVL